MKLVNAFLHSVTNIPFWWNLKTRSDFTNSPFELKYFYSILFLRCGCTVCLYGSVCTVCVYGYSTHSRICVCTLTVWVHVSVYLRILSLLKIWRFEATQTTMMWTSESGLSLCLRLYADFLASPREKISKDSHLVPSTVPPSVPLSVSLPLSLFLHM